jgi:2-polyprenyl-3-methyl-5-hydroxy-6-metoxy-1,4-benzoquinol methylase
MTPLRITRLSRKGSVTGRRFRSASDWLNRASLRLLYWGRKYRWIAFGITTFVGFGLIRGLVYVIQGPLDGTFISEYGGHLLSVLLAIAIFPSIAFYVERRNIRRVLSIAGRANGPNEAPTQSFLTENLQQMSEQLDALEGDGAVLPRYEVARWVKWCFETSTAKRYVGTDSHVPSQYRNIYADYLTAHERFIARVPRSESKRFMITHAEKLRADRAENPKDNAVFLEWHQTDHRKAEDAKGTKQQTVGLYQLKPPTNAELLKTAKLDLDQLGDTDIAFWDGDFILLFNPIKESIDPADGAPTEVRLRLREKGTSLYKECEKYVSLLEEKAQKLDRELPIYSSKLSKNWKRFAAPDLRIQQTVPLIKEVVARFPESKDRVRIFDAAAGVGFEAITLLDDGYDVQLNEIEQSLRDAARKYAKEKRVRLPEGQFSRINWLELNQQFQPGRFDVMLVLGNSLCHLEGLKQLSAAIRQFYSMLRPGGVLICDERNFDYIMERMEQIEPDPINNFPFNQHKDRVMYPGTDVLGAPFNYDGERLTFQYWEVQSHDGKFSTVGDAPLGTLSMYPFKRGVLVDVLRKSGFGTIEILCDLQSRQNGDFQDDCDFYTYVATKQASN